MDIEEVGKASDKAAKAISSLDERVVALALKLQLFAEHLSGASKSLASAGTSAQALGDKASNAAQKTGEAWGKVRGELAAFDEQAKVMGRGFKRNEEKAKALAEAIKTLTKEGMKADDPRLVSLGKQYKDASNPMGLLGTLGAWGAKIGALHALVVGSTAYTFGKDQVQHYADFEDSIHAAAIAMAGGSADMGTLRQSIEEMREKALDISTKFGFDPQQVSDVMMKLGSRGFKTSDIEAMAPTAMKLARAGGPGTDSKVATDLLIASIDGFYGLKKGASKQQEVGDLVAAAQAAGHITTSEMLDTVKITATTAGGLHQSMQGVLTLAAMLGHSGLTGATAGNSINSMMLKLAAPTISTPEVLRQAGLGGKVVKDKSGEKGVTILDALGIKASDAHGMLPIVDVLRQVVAKTLHMDESKRAIIFRELFGLDNMPESVAIIRAMAEEGGKAFTEVVAHMNQHEGALERANADATKDLKEAWEQLQNRAHSLGDRIVGDLSPALLRIVDFMNKVVIKTTDVVKWLERLKDRMDKAEKSTGSLAKAIGALKGATIALSLVLAPLVAGASLRALWIGLPLMIVRLPVMIGRVGVALSGLSVKLNGLAIASRALLAPIVPWALWIALFAAAFLIGQDFGVWLAGGDSLLEPLWNGVARFFKGWKLGLALLVEAHIHAFRKIWSWVSPMLSYMDAAFARKFPNIHATVHKWIGMARDEIALLADDLASLIEKVPGLKGVADAIRSMEPRLKGHSQLGPPAPVKLRASPQKANPIKDGYPTVGGRKAMFEAAGNIEASIAPNLQWAGAPSAWAAPTVETAAPILPMPQLDDISRPAPAATPYFSATLHIHANNEAEGRAAGRAATRELDSWWDNKHRKAHADPVRSKATRKR